MRRLGMARQKTVAEAGRTTLMAIQCAEGQAPRQLTEAARHVVREVGPDAHQRVERWLWK